MSDVVRLPVQPAQTSLAGSDGSSEGDRVGEELRQFKNALVSRQEIGIAQGMLMLTHHIDGEQAFALLCRRSKDERIHIRAVAREVSIELGFGPKLPSGR
jgi:AmiR/NasT family two-component response regulator